MLLAAIGCGRIPGILDIIQQYSFVVFGTMDEKQLSHFADSRDRITPVSNVYFYETG